MNKTITKSTKVTITTCDFCGKEAIPYSRRVKACPICGRDVCYDCAIVTDHWCLEDGSFTGDYPDHYCKECWKGGEDIRRKIQDARDAEGELWEKWHKLGKKNEIPKTPD